MRGLSLYADDAALFLNRTKEEVTAVKRILSTFGAVSGLVTNMTKSAVFPICENIDTAAAINSITAANYYGRTP